MTNQTAINLVTNKITDLNSAYTNLAQTQTQSLISDNLAELSKFGKMQEQVCAVNLENTLLKFPTFDNAAQNAANNVCTASIDLFNNKQAEITSIFSSTSTSLLSNINGDFFSSLSLYANDIIAQAPGAAASIGTLVTNAANSFSSQISTIATGALNSFVNLANNIQTAFVVNVNALISSTVNKLNTIKNSAIKSSEVAYDFFKRSTGLSSTAPYIQANVPKPDGGLVAKPSALDKSPDNVILLPNLKKDTNSVKEFIQNPLAKLLGFVSSLIPSKIKNPIEEPKPTADKNVYGQTIANVDKGGNVIVNTITPGNVTRTVIHPTGSSERVLNDGSKVYKTVADKTEITDGNWKITTTKDKIEIINGNEKIEIRQNHTKSITGNSNIAVDGESNLVINKNVNNDYKSDESTKITGNSNLTVDGNRINKTGPLTETINGNHKETVMGNLTIQVSGNVSLIASGSVNIAGAGGVRITGPSIKLG